MANGSLPRLNGNGRFPLEQTTIRTFALIVLVPAFVGFGFWSGQTLTQIQNDIAAIKAEMQAARGDRFRRADMAEWCRAWERENSQGTCPDPYALPSFQRPHSQPRRSLSPPRRAAGDLKR